MNINKWLKVLILVLITIFIIVNIIWVFFYFNQKSYLNTLMEKFEFKNEGPHNSYIYRDENLEYGYRFVIPKYLNFRVNFQTACNYNIKTGEDGKYVVSKKYHSVLTVNKYLWDKNWFYIELDQTADDEGYYMESSACERIDYYPNLIEKKVWHGISDKDEAEVREFFSEANEDVNEVYNKTIELFGDEYFK